MLWAPAGWGFKKRLADTLQQVEKMYLFARFLIQKFSQTNFHIFVSSAKSCYRKALTAMAWTKKSITIVVFLL